MFSPLLAVLKDLWLFILRREDVDSVKHFVEEVVVQQTLPLSEVQLTPAVTNIFTESVSVWVCAPEAQMWISPNMSFDGVERTVRFGDRLAVVRRSGDLLGVTQGNSACWIREHDVTSDKQAVLPDVQHGVLYEADHVETKKIRNIIQDVQKGGLLNFTLQSSEYVLYKLHAAGVHITWPNERPRVAGKWQQILRGKKGVTITVEPRTHSVLERMSEHEERSCLGYVTAVHPDNSIMLESVGLSADGIYEMQQVTYDEWREWRPVFISFA